MKTFFLNKKNKKIKLHIKKFTNLQGKICQDVNIKGPLGSINHTFTNVIIKENRFFIPHSQLNFFIKKLNKLIDSVTKGWFVELNLNGLGYKSFKLKDKIALDLGYSNLITFKPNSAIKVKNFKNKIVLFALNEEYLRNVCSNLRNYSKPDPYKGKGLLFKNENIKLKKKAKS